jgi:simple sugar transport system permease protein
MKRILQSSGFRELLRVVIAVTVALALGFIVTVLVSEDPIGAYKSFLFGPLSKLNRFGDWIEESITLIFLGLAVAIVFKAELFSLGQEGQMVLGALVAGSIALFVPLPAYFRIPLAILGAMLVGFLWGLIPGYLKAHLNANEIVSTLMLLSEVRTLFMNQTNISIALYLVVIATIVVYYLMYHTPFGYELRMVGANIKFARYGGVNTKRTIVLAMAVSGIFAGLAGAHLASGVHRKLILNITFGLGFEGIIVALLARNNPLLIPFTGLAYGYLRAGANIMERTSDVSREMVLVIQGIIILLVTAERIMPIIQERLSVRRARRNKIPPADADATSTEGGD